MLTRIIIAVALIASTGGIGYGVWQGRIASSRAADIVELQTVLLAKETALRGAEARAGALASRLKTAEVRAKENKRNEDLDKAAVEAHPDWSSQRIPAGIAERLLDY